jgi:hypothetical protein
MLTLIRVLHGGVQERQARTFEDMDPMDGKAGGEA